MFGVIRSVVILPEVWCYEISGYPARCFELCQWLSCHMTYVMSVANLPEHWLCQWLSYQVAGVMRVIILPDVCCYHSSYPARSLMLCQWLSWQLSGVMSVDFLPDV